MLRPDYANRDLLTDVRVIGGSLRVNPGRIADRPGAHAAGRSWVALVLPALVRTGYASLARREQLRANRPQSRVLGPYVVDADGRTFRRGGD
ncbi:hypothetical protein JCM18899A_19220 [Nocardioides sp. AN3]